jgi:SAM-dependent methyltransferase
MPSPERLGSPLRAGLTQAGAAALAVLPLFAGLEVTAAQWAVVQGAIAMRIAVLAGADSWWIVLHLAFAPAAVWAHTLALSPVWWAAAFALLLVVFGSTFRTQVPLFLTARAVRQALGSLLDPARPQRIVDLGCGLGSVLTALKRARPDCVCEGVELALLPYIVSRLRAARTGCRVERRDLMTVDLSRYDVVYAFLSPAPMQALWAKARREMRPGSRFVSLAFPVPGVAPDRIIAVSDQPRHTLHVWTM